MIYVSGIKTNLHVASSVSLLQKPEFTASAVLGFNDVLGPRSANCGPQVTSSPPSVFINKVVLDPVTPVRLDIISDGFHATTIGLKDVTENVWPAG